MITARLRSAHDGFSVAGETEHVLDLLGVVRFGEVAGWRPFVMGGFSQAKWNLRS